MTFENEIAIDAIENVIGENDETIIEKSTPYEGEIIICDDYSEYVF